ncbi:MAG: metallophosphoesterase [Deltaproteobacteria bacterium]|nr:metallophosphoesterase [Deltaproteobacteria bacterium]
MKIAFISDLHVDISPDNLKLIDFLIERLQSLKPDLFIIAGDIAAKIQLFENTLNMFSDISCNKFIVPGNHDIWIDSPAGLEEGIHSGSKYYELLPQVCERNGFTYLGLEPHIIDGIGFAGTLGWYDYTMRNKKYDNSIPMEAYRNKQYEEKYTWNDLNFAHWMDTDSNKRKSDEEVAQEMEASLKQQIQSLNEQGIKNIVAITHHVPFREMISYQNTLPWDFFSAFMGSEGLGRIILEESTVTHVICGHSHLKNHLNIGKVRAMKSPVGYPREWSIKDLHKLAEDRLDCFELQ